MSNWINLNPEGRIPVNAECPYAKICKHKRENGCHHYGTDHGFVFSCATARAYDIVLKCDPNHPQFEGLKK